MKAKMKKYTKMLIFRFGVRSPYEKMKQQQFSVYYIDNALHIGLYKCIELTSRLCTLLRQTPVSSIPPIFAHPTRQKILIFQALFSRFILSVGVRVARYNIQGQSCGKGKIIGFSAQGY